MNKEITISVRTIVRVLIALVFVYLCVKCFSLSNAREHVERELTESNERNEKTIDSLKSVVNDLHEQDSIYRANIERMLYNEENGISNLAERG